VLLNKEADGNLFAFTPLFIPKTPAAFQPQVRKPSICTSTSVCMNNGVYPVISLPTSSCVQKVDFAPAFYHSSAILQSVL